ncbi:MAG TPA: hypothetical protein VGB64_05675 [Actinomycetota bacterium]
MSIVRHRVPAGVCLLALASTIAGPRPAPAVDAPDHVRIRVVAGPSGASNVGITLAGEAAQAGTGTLISGVAVGLDLGGFRGGRVLAQPLLGSGARIATAEDWGGAWIQAGNPIGVVYGFTAGATLTAPPLGPGDIMEFIAFFPNGTVTFDPPAVTFDQGSVTTTVATSTGSRALVVADDGDAGDAIAAGGIAFGRTEHSLASAEGLAGTIMAICNECSGTWRSPSTTFDWPWSEPADDFLPPFRMFAGPAGDWRWTWEGTQTSLLDSEAVYGAYVPVGDDWSMFRSGSGE